MDGEARQAEDGAPSTATTAELPQDLALIVESGVISDNVTGPHPSFQSTGATASSGAGWDGDGAHAQEHQEQEQSLAHYRATVAAARAVLEASRARKAGAPATATSTATASAEADGAQKDGSSSTEGNVGGVLPNSGDEEAGSTPIARPSASQAMDGASEAPMQGSSALPTRPRKRRRVVVDGASVSGSGSDASSASSSSSDSEVSSSSSDSDLESESDEDASSSDSDQSSSPAPRPSEAARVDTLPAWASAGAYGDDFSDDEDDDGGPNQGDGTARGPKTKHELAPTDLAPVLNKTAFSVLPPHEEMRYLGRVSSIIGPVVVVEQHVRRSKAGVEGMAGEEEMEEVGHDVLDNGSLLVYDNRKVLGTVFETFGSVLQPMYTIRFASAADIPSLDAVSAPPEASMDEADDGDIDGAPLTLDKATGLQGARGNETGTAQSEDDSKAEAGPAETDPQPATAPPQPEDKAEEDSKAATNPEDTTRPTNLTPLTVGTPIFYAPRHSTFVFTRQLRRLKGSDASNLFDEEVGEDEMEFSDDEAEAEARRRRKKGGGRGAKSGRVGGEGGGEASVDTAERGEPGGRGGRGGGSSGRGHERGRGARGGGGSTSRGRGRGRGRGGGGMHTPHVESRFGARHRDDLGGEPPSLPFPSRSNPTTAMAAPTSTTHPPLPASLPARPMFSYDYGDGSQSSPGPRTGGGGGGRSMPTPYDEPAGVTHTLTLPQRSNTALPMAPSAVAASASTVSGQHPSLHSYGGGPGPGQGQIQMQMQMQGHILTPGHFQGYGSAWPVPGFTAGPQAQPQVQVQVGQGQGYGPGQGQGQGQGQASLPTAPHINPLFAQQWGWQSGPGPAGPPAQGPHGPPQQ